MSISLDYATLLGAWHDKEGSIHWPISGTADMTQPYCPSCSRPEHGNLACDYPFATELAEPLPPGLPVTYRIMWDGEVFEVHPGSPPNEDDHCCLCASRKARR